MAKRILLARPHPMIATTMVPFLQENGYDVTKIDKFDEIKSKILQSDAVVISLALFSSIKQTFSEVYKEIRRLKPYIPVVFVSLIDFEKALPNLNLVSNESSEENIFIKINRENSNSKYLGKHKTFVYVSKNDLEDNNLRELSSKIIKRHLNN